MIKDFILNSRNVKRDSFIFNTIGAIENSFQTMVLLLVITRLGQIEDSSIFVIAYAVGNLVMTIGKYGTRNFQVTDIDEQYGFFEYILARGATTILLFLAVAIYLVKGIALDGATLYKTGCVFLVCVAKAVDSFEDVFHGRLQQLGRLDIAAKILAIRYFIFIVIFAVLYVMVANLMVVLVVANIVNIFLFGYLNLVAGDCYRFKRQRKPGKVVAMLKEVFPLALGMTLIMYLGNAPKYTIDGYFTDLEQTSFNIIYMPVFIIGLLSSFIFSPLMKSMAEAWASRELKKFQAIVRRQVGLIVFFTLGAIGGGYVIGLKLLELVYGVSLQGEMFNLVLLLVCGGLIALMTFYIALYTIWRQQKIVLVILALASAFYFIGANTILVNHATTGLILFYLAGLMVSDICLIIYGEWIVKNKKTNIGG